MRLPFTREARRPKVKAPWELNHGKCHWGNALGLGRPDLC